MEPRAPAGRKPRVLTVILNYRTPDMTLEAAAAAVRAMRGIAGEIVVVDNDSRDGSFEKLTAGVAAAGWPRIRVLASGGNGGFGAGNNFGVRAGLSDGARADYVYVLNPDAFPEAGAIHALLRHLEDHPRVGFAGSFVRGPDGAAHHTAFRYPSIPGEFEGAARMGPVSRLLARHVVPIPFPQATCEVDWVAGASLMMRRTTLDEIGLFDEGFFLYFEETDLCLRARRAGWSVAYVHDSVVVHIGSVSTGLREARRKPAYWFDSRLRYFVKNHGPWYAAAATGAHVAGGLLWRLRRLVENKPVEDPPYLLWDMTAHALRALAGAGGARAREIAAGGGAGAAGGAERGV